MGFVWIVASRYLRSKRRLSFITLISLLASGGVFVGVAALTIVLSVMNGFEDQVQRRIAGTNAHIAVLSADDRPVQPSDSLVQRIAEAAPGAAVAPFVYGKVMVASRNSVDGMVMKGVEPSEEARVTDIMSHLSPAETALDGGDLPGIGLGEELAVRLRVSRGDVILISLPTEEPGGLFGGIPRVKRLRVSSIFRSGLYEYDSSFGIVRIDTAREFFELGRDVTGYELRIPDMFRAREVAHGLEARLGTDYRVTNWIDLNRNLFSWMKIEKAVMFTILILIVLVATVNIVSSLVMLVLEKRRDIGVLRTMGVTPRGIMRIFLLQGTLVGIGGTTIGLIVGLAVSFALGRYKLLRLPGEIYFIDTLPVKIEWTDFALVGVAATALCFLASLYPAWRAARLAPVESIRYE
ncbi:MAG: ABC transporter permease [Candidatus Eisenbacteria bacterium]|uniref:ABC transporter permease n=1 Tax=Eiseniibacteriota bacterium TaxID=2212470 RepID=A0A538TG89_UNCEI|nr:MAG: ABC transporter permease [Candidatus Eisenbacteria bacterium]TMQ62642.1 MAG: ABC transporter permease [Candidatus Eisenbacteria bacterium]